MSDWNDLVSKELDIDYEKVFEYPLSETISVVYHPVDNIYFAEHIDDNIYDNIIILKEDNKIQFEKSIFLFDEVELNLEQFNKIEIDINSMKDSND